MAKPQKSYQHVIVNKLSYIDLLVKIIIMIRKIIIRRRRVGIIGIYKYITFIIINIIIINIIIIPCEKTGLPLTCSPNMLF